MSEGTKEALKKPPGSHAMTNRRNQHLGDDLDQPFDDELDAVLDQVRERYGFNTNQEAAEWLLNRHAHQVRRDVLASAGLPTLYAISGGNR